MFPLTLAATCLSGSEFLICLDPILRLSVSSTSSWPGPGCYTPNWEALRPCLAKGAPSFKRYSAREISKEPQVTQVTQEAEEAEIEMLPMEGQKASVAFTCPGGKIQPLPRTRPRSSLTLVSSSLFKSFHSCSKGQVQ